MRFSILYLLAGVGVVAMEREHSAGWIKEFLEEYDGSFTEVSFALKRRMVGLLFQNIKIVRKEIFSF